MGCKLIFILVLFFYHSIVFSQDSIGSFKLIKEKKGIYTMLQVDALGNIYLLNNANRLVKYNDKLDSVSVFNNNRRYNKISNIDVSNPLRPILYFEKFTTVIATDRFLNTNYTINLRNIQVLPPAWAFSSYDNLLWVYSAANASLQKIEITGKSILQTIDLRIISKKIPQAHSFFDDGMHVLIYDSLQGFFVFDRYGSFEKLLDFKNLKNIHHWQNKLWAINNNQLFVMNNKTLEINNYTLPNEYDKAKVIRRHSNRVYILKNDGLYIYEII